MRFQVFRKGKPVDRFGLRGAYLFGNDGIAIRRAQITFKDGFIECKKPTMETAGLTLLWPIDGFGEVLLPTTCLPERALPYNLNVEITRAKLMQIITKREDWSFFRSIEGLGDTSKEAQDLFIEAIQNISEAEKASQLADECLKRAIVFSEKLAIKQAELLFNARAKNRGFSRVCFGCRVGAAHIYERRYVEELSKLFGFVTIPMEWKQIEPRKGSYDFSLVDACVEVMGDKRLAMGSGPLLWFSSEHLPGWLLESGGGI